MVTHFLQRSRSTLSSLVQTILTSLLMLYQNTFRKPTSIKHALVCCFCKVTQVFKCFSGDSEMFLSNKIKPLTCYQVSKPVLWTRPNPSSSSPLSVLLIHMGHNHQQQHLPVSPPNFKFFLHNVKVIKFEKQSSLTLRKIIVSSSRDKRQAI